MEELSSYYILTRLNTAKGYAVTKGNELIEEQADGDEDCDKEIDELKLLNSLIDAIERYSIIYNRPSVTFSVETANSGSDVSIVFGDTDLGTVTMSSGTAAGEASEIANYINGLGGVFTAVANTKYVTVYAENGSLSNEIDVDVTATAPMALSVPAAFSDDGRDYFSENEDRCLTDEEIEFILEKIRRITPSCSNTTSFSRNSILESLPDVVFNIFLNGVFYDTVTAPATESSVTINITD